VYGRASIWKFMQLGVESASSEKVESWEDVGVLRLQRATPLRVWLGSAQDDTVREVVVERKNELRQSPTVLKFLS
jgi:hypothetical protein